jgi:AraC-like DNA-binding protein
VSLKYQEHPISDLLKPYVTLIWSMETEGKTSSIAPVRILPDTCVEFVIHFKKPYVTTFPDHVRSLQPQSFIVGQMKRPFVMEPAGGVGLIAARFSAWGAYHFFSFPLREVADQFVDLNFLWSHRAKEIEYRIITEKNTSRRIERLQEILLLQLLQNNQHDKTVDYALSLIRASNGLLSIRDLAQAAGCSERQLLRKFDRCVGLSPKEFARIVRVHHALRALRLYPEKSLTEVTYECGYHDQAHFIREFNAFTGFTPGEYNNKKENVFF